MYAIVFILPFPMITHANSNKMNKVIAAETKGEMYLGKPGNSITISLGKSQCKLESIGVSGIDGNPPKKFLIELTCENKKQILWDIAKATDEEFGFDDPMFQLIWAGDKDGDGKIDLKMEMSPKYSCSKKVFYLSSMATHDQIVGIEGKPKLICGE